MIEGGWEFVYAAYAVSGAAFVSAAVVVLLRLRHWAREARRLDKK